MRLDVYLSENNFVKSRTAAQCLINIGGVYVNGRISQKSSMNVTDADIITIEEIKKPKYVGRGGLKLEGALESFGIDISGAVCVDIGASTGGFTDCMLQHGAAKVSAPTKSAPSGYSSMVKSRMSVCSREITRGSARSSAAS